MKFVTAEQQQQVTELLTASKGKYWNCHNYGYISKMDALGILKKYNNEGELKSSYMVALYNSPHSLNPLFADDKYETGVFLSGVSVGAVLHDCSDEEVQRHNDAYWFLGKEHLEVLARF